MYPMPEIFQDYTSLSYLHTPARQTGNTTRMLQAAVESACRADNVVIICYNYMAASNNLKALRDILGEYFPNATYNINQRSVSFGRGSIRFISATQDVVRRGDRISNLVVGFDHYFPQK